jgi:Arc/MetJ-type ribon-helix-helix transcriptional regulator
MAAGENEGPGRKHPGLEPSRPPVLRESKVTVKIPRPLYRKIQAVVEGSGFNSPTDFIVYVLRDLMGEADDPAKAEPKSEYSKEELEELKRKLKNLGYL